MNNHTNTPKKGKQSLKDSLNNNRETFVYIFVMSILFFMLLVFLVPNPFRSKSESKNSSNYIANIKQEYSLPEVCKLIDPASAQLIISDEIIPYNESIPSSSTIVCTYSNTTRSKGISLIARKYNSSSEAKTDLVEKTNDSFISENEGGIDIVYDNEGYQTFFVDQDIMFNMQYIGFEDLDLIKQKKDISLITSKL